MLAPLCKARQYNGRQRPRFLAWTSRVPDTQINFNFTMTCQDAYIYQRISYLKCNDWYCNREEVEQNWNTMIKKTISLEPSSSSRIGYKEHGCYSITFLNWTPIFDWCVSRWGSKNKHHKGICFKEICVCFREIQILLTTSHSVVNTFRRTYVFS